MSAICEEDFVRDRDNKYFCCFMRISIIVIYKCKKTELGRREE